jgi:predicted TIM-barrel fold metal-dependent hydrolase
MAQCNGADTGERARSRKACSERHDAIFGTHRHPGPPMQTLATMIFDGVLDRFPDLKIGVIEQGCVWLPSWMKQMESAFDAFVRHEERLQQLSMRPTEFVERQVRVTPYPTEDVEWVTGQTGPNVLLFNTDFPHVEGGRRPYERFEASLGDASEDILQRFYAANFVDLMGAALDRLPVAV